MAKKKTPPAKTTKSQPTEASLVKSPRRLKAPTYQRGRFQKRIKHPGPKLNGSFTILRHSFGILRRNKRLFATILIIYTILSLVLVRGFTSSTNLPAVKTALDGSKDTALNNSTALLGNLFSASGTSNPGATTYQSLLFLIISLAIIWALRQVYGKHPNHVRAKAAFYQGMAPFVPFVLVLVVMSLQLIPLIVGTSIFALVLRNGLAASGLEQFLWGTVWFMFCLWSFYMITSSIFALYIVTLPDVKPLEALRSAKELVRFRRWTVMRKVLFLPLILFILTCIIMLPIVLLLTGVAEWVLFVLSLGMVIIGHSYLYNLYREMM